MLGDMEGGMRRVVSKLEVLDSDDREIDDALLEELLQSSCWK